MIVCAGVRLTPAALTLYHASRAACYKPNHQGRAEVRAERLSAFFTLTNPDCRRSGKVNFLTAYHKALQ